MKPTRKRLEIIFEAVDKYTNLHEQVNKALHDLFKLLSPTEYTPLIERDALYD